MKKLCAAVCGATILLVGEGATAAAPAAAPAAPGASTPPASTPAASTPAETAMLLKSAVAEKDAIIWYVGHHSYAIKTHSHLLIFDYYPMNDPSPNASVVNGAINPAEFRDMNVVVFVSHRDGDHYDKVIWEWKKTIPRITYVLGWEPAMPTEKYTHIQPWETGRVGDIEVTTLPSTDSGESYLIRVDGLVFYHSGDNAMWMPSYRPRYTKQIDWLAAKTGYVDFMFINWRLGNDGPQLTEGMWYAADKLGARYIFPSHMGTNDAQVKDLIAMAPSDEVRARIVDKEVRGQRFIYQGGRMQW